MERFTWNPVVVIFWQLKTRHFPNDIANVYSEQPSFLYLHTRSDTPWFLEHHLMTPWLLSNVRYSWLGPFSDSAMTSKFLNVSRAKRKKKYSFWDFYSSYGRSVLGVHWKDWCWSKTPILWPPHSKSWLIGKDPDAGRDWEQEEKGTTDDEMAGWHHRLDGHEFE